MLMSNCKDVYKCSIFVCKLGMMDVLRGKLTFCNLKLKRDISQFEHDQILLRLK